MASKHSGQELRWLSLPPTTGNAEGEQPASPLCYIIMTETTDFYLAAYLLAKKYNLERVDRTNPKKVVFCFDGGRDETVSFFHRECSIEPLRYALCIKRLKKVLYEDRNTG